MTQTTSWMAPTRRLRLTTITVRNAWQRLSMTLVLVMLAMTAQQAWASTFSGGSGTISGGIVSAKGNVGMSATNGSITLGWMKADDSIYSSSYSGTVTLAKAFIDDDDNTYESGTVSASAIAGKTLRPHVSIVSGGANGDGQVTLADAVAVVNYILGNPSENFNASNADVDGNGSITITDAVRIVDMLLNQ